MRATKDGAQQALFPLSFSLLKKSQATRLLLSLRKPTLLKMLRSMNEMYIYFLWINIYMHFYICYMAYLCSYSQTQHKLMCSRDDLSDQTTGATALQHSTPLPWLRHIDHSLPTMQTGCSQPIDHVSKVIKASYAACQSCHGWSLSCSALAGNHQGNAWYWLQLLLWWILKSYFFFLPLLVKTSSGKQVSLMLSVPMVLL